MDKEGLVWSGRERQGGAGATWSLIGEDRAWGPEALKPGGGAGAAPGGVGPSTPSRGRSAGSELGA